MRHLLVTLLTPNRRIHRPSFHLSVAHYKPQQDEPAPPPPKPPKPPKKAATFTLHNQTWEDQYSWMSNIKDKVAMRHMEVHMEQEINYTEAVMSDTERLQSKLQSEMMTRMDFQLSTTPVRWGPWLYYRRVEQGKQHPVFCRRLFSKHEEFISNKDPSCGFDFTTGQKIEQKLLDYNQEAERFGGYVCEGWSEVSPDHRFFAYTMFDKDNDFFKLSVRDLNFGSICSNPQANRVSSLAWAMDGKALLYVVTDDERRPYKIYCNILGTTEDVLIYEEPEGNIHVCIRNTKDFRFVTVNTFSAAHSKVFLINAADPLSGLTLVWEGEASVHCIVEHHQGYLYLFTDAAREGQPVNHHYIMRTAVDLSSGPKTWENVFIDDPGLIIEDVEYSDSYLVLLLREGRNLKLCSVALPLPHCEGAVHLKELNPRYLTLPNYVCQISPGLNYDYYSPTMRFTISSPVMPDAVVDYELSSGTWNIIQQQNLLLERTRVLYGSTSSVRNPEIPSRTTNDIDFDHDHLWNSLSEYYACEQYEVPSHDGVLVSLTVVYSRNRMKQAQNPGLLHGNGAYGELLDKRWRSEQKSLLDRGWVIAYADVRGGGGGGKKWHQDGKCTKKYNSINDYISCAKFLIEREIVQHDKLAGWGNSAGGLLVASAINCRPHLFRAAVLKVPFLDPRNTLFNPVFPLKVTDYEEFGIPGDVEEFDAVQKYSPYDNILKGVLYPAVLVTSSLDTRFGVWEAAKWVARVREDTIYDPKRPILLNLSTELVEENRYHQCKDSALETAFLLKMMDS